MIRYILRFLSITICAVLMQGFGHPLWAQTDDVSIDLNFEKTHFADGEPIPVEVVVSNTSGSDLFISRGFTSRNYCLRIRIIDPAGKTILPVTDGQDTLNTESPDAPPLGYIADENGRPVKVKGCELFEAGGEIICNTEDLRQFYDLSLPGYYSAQVQITAMVFNDDTCAAYDYAWRGLLTSETVYFYVQANSSGAQVIPDQWKLSWLDDDKNVPYILVQIRSLKGQEVEDINPDSITLNGVNADSVNVLPPKLKAFFNAREAIYSLEENLEAGAWYRVIITGRLKNGNSFGSEQQIRIVK